ncbi:AMP-binding protein [Pseudonocardia sichuanensis]
MAVEPHPRGDAPFDVSGIERDVSGVAHYATLPDSLVAMVRASVERFPDVEALVEVGGERLTYRQLWDRAARVAGGLVAAGVGRGDRVATLLPAGVDWVLGFLGTQLAGAVAVPVNTRFAPPEIEYVLADSGASVVLRPGEPLPDGPPHADDALTPWTSPRSSTPAGPRASPRAR